MKRKEYSIASDYKEVAPLCKNIRVFCLNLGFNSTECNEIEICLTEALNNIIKHAYKEDFTKEIEVNVFWEDGWAKFELIDKGVSRKEFKKPKLEFDPKDIENLPEGGMGLFIIDQLMNEISYKTENGVNIFTMKKNIV